MTLSEVLRRQIAALEAATPRLQQHVGEYAVATIKETWPDVGGRWPYATGASIAGWLHAPGENGSVRISNDVDHHRYTEYGYTRYGRGTARSYEGIDYSHGAMESIEGDIYQIIADYIGRALNA